MVFDAEYEVSDGGKKSPQEITEGISLALNMTAMQLFDCGIRVVLLLCLPGCFFFPSDNPECLLTVFVVSITSLVRTCHGF